MMVRLVSVSLCLLALLWVSWLPVSVGIANAPESVGVGVAADLCHTGTVAVQPLHPMTDDVVQVHVSGWWGSSCPAVAAVHAVSGPQVTLAITVTDLLLSEPIGCLDVVTPWAITHTVGQLPANQYTLAVDVVAGGCWSFDRRIDFAVVPFMPSLLHRHYLPCILSDSG